MPQPRSSSPPEPQQPPSQPPPPSGGQVAAATGTAGAVGAGAAAVGAGVAAATVAAGTEKVIAAVMGWFTSKRSKDYTTMELGLRKQFPTRPKSEVQEALRAEAQFSAWFQKNMIDRLRADLPVALAEPDPEVRNAKVEALLKRERRYTEQHERARWTRGVAVLERHVLRELSPRGAYWWLSPDVKQHTPDCHPAGVMISGPEAVGGAGRPYSGQLVKIVVASGQELAVTPNHPVLTARGWVPAGEIREGDDLIAQDVSDPEVGVPEDHEDVPAAVEDLIEAMEQGASAFASQRPVDLLDFHGDGVADTEVRVVAKDRGLMADLLASRFQKPGYVEFFGSDPAPGSLAADGGLRGGFFAPRRDGRAGTVERCSSCGSLIGGETALREGVGVVVAAKLDSRFKEARAHGWAGDAVALRERLDRLPRGVVLDKVVNVKSDAFTGHVYSVTTAEGWYWANGLAVKNCVALGGRFWPWEVIDQLHPPMHYGCACQLFSEDEAVTAGWMSHGDVPDTSDAVIRAQRIVEKFGLLLEADVTDEELDVFVRELQEASAGRYDRRWAKGTVAGGQFRPLRGGIPGLRAKALRALNALVDGGAPSRVVALRGKTLAVPSGRWERSVDGVRFHSPPGGTNVYREGLLVSEPGKPSRHLDVRVPQSPGGKKSVDLGQVRKSIADQHAEKIKNALVAMDPAVPPVGSWTGAAEALLAAGFVPSEREPLPDGQVQLTWVHGASGSTLKVTLDERRQLVDGVWTPGLKRAERSRTDEQAQQLVSGWEAFPDLMIGWSDEAGERYDDHGENQSVVINPVRWDTSGQRDWSGNIELGPDAQASMDLLAAQTRANVPLTPEMAEQVYRTVQTGFHESSHGIGPLDPWDFGNPESLLPQTLEETLTEEVSHVLAVEKLHEIGRDDVLDEVLHYPQGAAALGVYRQERLRLKLLLDDAHVAPEDRRELLFRLAFQTPSTADRVDVLAGLLAEAQGISMDDARERVSTKMLTVIPVEEGVKSVAADVVPSAPRLILDKNGAAIMKGAKVKVKGGFTGEVWRVDDGQVWVWSGKKLRCPDVGDVTVTDPVVRPGFGSPVRWENWDGSKREGVLLQMEGASALAMTDDGHGVLLDDGAVKSWSAVAVPQSPGESGGADKQLLDMLANIAGLHGDREGLRFGSWESFVLAEGQRFDPVALPADDEKYRGEPKECFKNAADAVLGLGGQRMRTDWHYVEGYAMAPGVPFPVEHAWAVDDDGNVKELTWPDTGTAYFGVQFSRDALRDGLMDSGHYGLMGTPDGLELLKYGLPKSIEDLVPRALDRPYGPTMPWQEEEKRGRDPYPLDPTDPVDLAKADDAADQFRAEVIAAFPYHPEVKRVYAWEASEALKRANFPVQAPFARDWMNEPSWQEIVAAARGERGLNEYQSQARFVGRDLLKTIRQGIVPVPIAIWRGTGPDDPLRKGEPVVGWASASLYEKTAAEFGQVMKIEVDPGPDVALGWLGGGESEVLMGPGARLVDTGRTERVRVGVKGDVQQYVDAPVFKYVSGPRDFPTPELLADTTTDSALADALLQEGKEQMATGNNFGALLGHKETAYFQARGIDRYTQKAANALLNGLSLGDKAQAAAADQIVREMRSDSQVGKALRERVRLETLMGQAWAAHRQERYDKRIAEIDARLAQTAENYGEGSNAHMGAVDDAEVQRQYAQEKLWEEQRLYRAGTANDDERMILSFTTDHEGAQTQVATNPDARLDPTMSVPVDEVGSKWMVLGGFSKFMGSPGEDEVTLIRPEVLGPVPQSPGSAVAVPVNVYPEWSFDETDALRDRARELEGVEKGKSLPWNREDWKSQEALALADEADRIGDEARAASSAFINDSFQMESGKPAEDTSWGQLGFTDAGMKARDSYVVDDEKTLEMQRKLRAGGKPTSKAYRIDKMIREVTVARPIQVWRGVVLDDVTAQAFQPGMTWTDPAFMSADLEEGHAHFYADTRTEAGATGSKVLFRVRVEPGVNAAYVGYGEVVLPRNTTTRVTAVGEKDGVPLIDMTVGEPPVPQSPGSSDAQVESWVQWRDELQASGDDPEMVKALDRQIAKALGDGSDPSEVWYHGTNTAPEDMEPGGLQPGDSESDAGAGVYLTATYADALNYGTHVYRVDTRDLNLDWDESGAAAGARISRVTIPEDRVEMVTADPVKEAVRTGDSSRLSEVELKSLPPVPQSPGSDMVSEYIAKRGPFLYHHTTPDSVTAIRKHGLKTRFDSGLDARSMPPSIGDRVYLNRDPTGLEVGATIAVDIRKLDPALFIADEDVPMRTYLDDRPVRGGRGGQEHTRESLVGYGTIAYRASIPVDAIAPPIPQSPGWDSSDDHGPVVTDPSTVEWGDQQWDSQGGVWGKGLVTDDAVTTWNVASMREGGGPHHDAILEHVDPYDEVGLNALRITIHPSGWFMTDDVDESLLKDEYGDSTVADWVPDDGEWRSEGELEQPMWEKVYEDRTYRLRGLGGGLKFAATRDEYDKQVRRWAARNEWLVPQSPGSEWGPWSLRSNVPGSNPYAEAAGLYRRAEAGERPGTGGVAQVGNQEWDQDLADVVAGVRPAAMELGDGYAKQIREALLADGWKQAGFLPDAPKDITVAVYARESDRLLVSVDPQMHYAAVSRDPARLAMLNSAAYGHPMDAWRHVQTGVALGYSPEDVLWFAGQEKPSTLGTDITAVRGDIATAAQQVYDEWEQDTDGLDAELGGGGICDVIADRVGQVLADRIDGVTIADGGQPGDDHAYVIAVDGERAFAVDIPQGLYETGGGYSWTKVQGTTFTPEDVQVIELDAATAQGLRDEYDVPAVTRFRFDADAHALRPPPPVDRDLRVLAGPQVRDVRIRPTPAPPQSPGMLLAGITGGQPPALPQMPALEQEVPFDITKVRQGDLVVDKAGERWRVAMGGLLPSWQYARSTGHPVGVVPAEGKVGEFGVTMPADAFASMVPALPPVPQSPGSGEGAGIPVYEAVDLQMGKGAGGSNGARWAFDGEGTRWLVKAYRGDEDRVATEALANAVYRAVGVPAADAGLLTVTADAPDFRKVADREIGEPPLPVPAAAVEVGDKGPLSFFKKHAAPKLRQSTGVVVVEPDGRVWVFEPKDHFGGYEHSWPKGGLEPGYTPQQNALKELWEETGLHATITGFLGDYAGDTGSTRMYVAVRTGGEALPVDDSPFKKGGRESREVKAVTPGEAAGLLNRSRDKQILADALAAGLPAGQVLPDDTPSLVQSIALAYPTVDGETRRIGRRNQALGEGFMTDALLANWDVVGLSDDNVLWTGEKDDWEHPVRLDQGGTFEMRAKGGPKAYGPVPSEVWSMRDRKGGQAFDTMLVTDEGLRVQAAHIGEVLTPARVDALVDSAPFADLEMKERVRENLKARVKWMRGFAAGQEGLPETPVGEEARLELQAHQADVELFPEEEDTLRWAGDGGWDAINTHLRSGAKKDDAPVEVQDAVSVLDALFGDVPALDSDLRLYAPLSAPGAAVEAAVGKMIADKGYLPLMSDPPTVEQAQGMAVLDLLVPAEAKQRLLAPRLILGLEDANGPEVVAGRGTRYRILGVVTGDDGQLYAQAVLL